MLGEGLRACKSNVTLIDYLIILELAGEQVNCGKVTLDIVDQQTDYPLALKLG